MEEGDGAGWTMPEGSRDAAHGVLLLSVSVRGGSGLEGEANGDEVSIGVFGGGCALRETEARNWKLLRRRWRWAGWAGGTVMERRRVKESCGRTVWIECRLLPERVKWIGT